MIDLLGYLKHFLEKVDKYKDRLLFSVIKTFWPKRITPNQLSYVRVAVGVFLAFLLFYLDIQDKLIVLSLFSFGILTDLFDGPVARYFKEETNFGATLDPVADRILILPIAIYSLFPHYRWLLLIILLVEGIHGIVSIFHKSHIPTAKANIFGNTRMVLVSFVFIIILIVWPDSPSLIFIDILWVSVFFSLLSIINILFELRSKGLIKNKIISKQIDKYNENI